MSGLVHIYCGDGKGKTTAAMGLAVRCAGWQKRVLVAQLMKQARLLLGIFLKHQASLISKVTVKFSCQTKM